MCVVIKVFLRGIILDAGETTAVLNNNAGETGKPTAIQVNSKIHLITKK